MLFRSQSSNTFTGLTFGTYPMQIRHLQNTNCSASLGNAVIALPVLTATPTALVPLPPYCTPANTVNTTYYISSFSTTGGTTNITNNASGFSTAGYGNFFNTMTATQATGSSINFSTAVTGGTFGINIFVDWNKNGVFTDPGEQVYGSAGYVSSASGSFTVPATALNGATRMRVVADWLSTNPTSCQASSYVEAEDYKFVVVNGQSSTPCQIGRAHV